ncbi:Jacalin-like lectin domain [Phytophthora cactorum]|nr:Jacalin-like lectin domain [Phytophthora cactorum]
MPSSATPEAAGTESDVTSSRRRSSVFTDGGGFEAPEEEDNNEEEEGLSSDIGFSAARLQAKVQTPGLKRRKRLTDLHHYVETQLQKRLFRSWDTIEIAFTGSGDMTVNQIVKFLQHSDVQLGGNDAAKVKKILEDHVTAVQAAQEESNEEGAEEDHFIRGRTKSKAVLSFEGFRQIFHPVDPQEATRWKREFDREKFRQRQEKDIYTRELEALEEKGKITYRFKCDPRDIPWETEQQRLQLRSQFLEVVFRKQQRRRILPLDISRLPRSDVAEAPGAQTMHGVPDKLSVKLILSTLLQKYSRNGHFESIEVPAAAYLYHDFAVDIMKQSIRRYWERFEIDQWPERQIVFRFRMKKQIFHDWLTFAERAKMLRIHVLRKFVAWKYMTRKLHEHYAFYRTSFWPFYVWKRHLQQMIIARGKTEFLMNVLRTYIQLRNFRALKLRFKTKQWNKKQIARVRKKKAKQICRICWETWKDRFLSSQLIRQIWRNHGNTLQQLHKFYMVRVTFYILRYYSILKRDMKQRKYMSCLSQFSVRARAKALAQHQRQHHGTNKHDRAAQQRGSLYPANNEQAKVSSTRRSLPISAYEPSQQRKGSMMDTRNTRGSISFLAADDEHNTETSRPNVHLDDPHAESNDGTSTVSLTRIMETELGKNIKRKSRLYDLCLGLYLKSTVLLLIWAFSVMSSRFRQWMIGTVYKLPPAAQDDKIEPVKKDNVAEDTGDKVVLHWREDREWRLQSIASNPIRAQQLRQDLLSIMENDAGRKETIRGRELLLSKKQANEDAFLRMETSATLKIKAAQMQQVQQIMRRRAHRLHDAMDNVYDVLLQQQARQQLKSSFRSLRIVVMMKYTKLLCHRAQIRNWLRFATASSIQQDKVPPFGSISEISIICGKKVDGICVVLKANGQASFEGSIHGNPFGTREVFSLCRGEKLVSVEGFASQSIYGLRFGTSAGRYSKWFGHCEKGSKFDIHSDYFNNREEIVGFFGHADSASINSLGIVMRHTTIKNPFEGLWVQKDQHTQHNMLQHHHTEEEGKKILLSGQEKYAVGEKLLSDGSSTMQIVDGFRDSAGQLDAATLGVKKIIELKEMMAQAQQQMVQGERLRDEGQQEIMRSQRFLPHLPTTKRMISAIRKMYKVVQTKDEIDHMNPELRSILLLKKSGGSEAEGHLPLQ